MAVTLISAARLMWCPGLAQLTGCPSGSVHDWFSTGTYAPAVSGKRLLLSGIDKRRFLERLGADINRMAMAASETLKSIVEIQGMPKSSAWSYVKLYYASLFYTHALLRIWGRSPTYLQTLELMRLRETLTAYAIMAPYKVQTGQYLVVADMIGSTVQMWPDNGGGGSHEAVWRELSKALSDLRQVVSSSQFLLSDKQNVDRQVASLATLVSKNSQNLAWLSQMRNSIQYRQAEGVWYPYRGKIKTSALQQQAVSIINGQVKLNNLVLSTESDLERFRCACTSIICFTREVIADMSEIGGFQSFLRHGQRKFEDAVAV